jgi:uncharacterized membrane protein
MMNDFSLALWLIHVVDNVFGTLLGLFIVTGVILGLMKAFLAINELDFVREEFEKANKGVNKWLKRYAISAAVIIPLLILYPGKNVLYGIVASETAEYLLNTYVK